MQEKIYLRPLSLNDIGKKYLSWVNDPIITEFLLLNKKRLKQSDLIKFIKDSPKDGRHNFAIITKSSQQHIGNCSIYGIEEGKSKFEIGYFIGEKKFWGGHYSSMAIFNLLKIGFIKMGLEKCVGYVDENNVKARMTNKFSGYKEIKKISQFNKKLKRKIVAIELEIKKKDWLKNTKKINSLYPKLYKI